MLSHPKNIEIDIPQGSVLGPILLFLYVNDFNQLVHLGSYNLYADDTLVYCTGNTSKELNEKIPKYVIEIDQ